MPNRIVRDGMLESEAVLSLPPEGRWLYVTILLSADDYGLFEATTFKLAKRADIKREHVGALVQSMVDADLVRLYRPDLEAARVFGFVTRFLQRTRIQRAKYPLPPMALLAGEDEELVGKIRALASQMTVIRAPMSDSRRPEAEAEADAEAEKGNTAPPSDEGGESATAVANAAAVVAKARKKRKAEPRPEALDCPHLRVLELWGEMLPELAQHDPEQWNGARADHLRQRWRDAAARDGWQTRDDGLLYFRRMFRWIRRSPFLMGQRDAARPGAHAFRMSLEWLVKPANYAKVIEGHYHDEGGR